MSKLKDLTGQPFGRLLVLERAKNTKYGAAQWLCKCSCPKHKEIVVSSRNLITGHTQSCGCWRKEQVSKKQKTHGMSRTRIYKIWCGIKTRCYDTKTPRYKDYGGRGITVCKEWHTFEEFYTWSMFNGYQENLSLDRIDNDKGYSPKNCRWVTAKEQANNTRQNRVQFYKGKLYTIAELSDITGINRGTLNTRINRLGWNVSKAIETPIDEKYHHKKAPN